MVGRNWKAAALVASCALIRSNTLTAARNVRKHSIKTTLFYRCLVLSASLKPRRIGQTHSLLVIAILMPVQHLCTT
uniref:Putative secreted peptide n=1 Tax=Anopheles braziliensis TaxID=58242 RepID=A0A2M3ZU49_9DIPT